MTPVTPTADELIDTLLAFINADTWAASRQILQANPELLHPNVDELMEALAQEQAEESTRRLVRDCRALLARCREVGESEAFAEKFGAGTVVPPGLEDDFAELLMQTCDRQPEGILAVCQRILAQLPPAGYQGFRAAVHHQMGTAYSHLASRDREGALCRAAACYRDALRLRDPETVPLDYAATQNDLGTIYVRMQSGHRADNVDRAIACLQEALRFRTPESNSLDYASTLHNLGAAYRQLPTGDRNENARRAIKCYEEALRFRTPEVAPLDYAATRTDLGIAYASLRTGDRAASLRDAIHCYRQALRICTPAVASEEYARIQTNLGSAYEDLGELSEAISCYQHALRFRTLEATPQEYAITQNNLGIAYLSLPAGDPAWDLSWAVRCFQEALRVWTIDTAPFSYARAQNNLALALSNLQTGDIPANLSQAVACFKEALRVWTPEAAPREHATTQNNLGNVYRNSQTGEVSENLKLAASCFRGAIELLSREHSPHEYATVQNNLGLLYAELPTGDEVADLTQAVACFQDALTVWTAETEPESYAQAQNNLGGVYRRLPAGDRLANLERAASCFRAALRIWTSKTAPLGRAMVQVNLGNVYRELPSGDRADNLQQAIICYQEALCSQTAEAAPLNYALIQNNLGLVYSELGTTGGLEEAITCFHEALRFWTPEVAPLDYAMVQNNLGTAISDQHDRGAGRGLTAAITCYCEALRFWTPEATPCDHAMVQNNLGIAYASLPEQTPDSQTQAIACYEAALRLRPADVAPRGFRTTAFNLANLHFRRENWREAWGWYQAATEAGERLYRAGLFATSKSSEVAENAAIYRHAAFTAVRLGDPALALLTLEQGKTRLLREALHLKASRPHVVPNRTWESFESVAASFRTAQDALPQDAASQALQELEVRRTTALLEEAVTEVRRYAPDFFQGISAAAIRDLIRDGRTAIVAFCVTLMGSAGLVVGPGDRPAMAVEVPRFTEGALRKLLIGQQGREETEGWLGEYLGNRDGWVENMEQRLLVLGRELVGPILSVLPPGVERLILVPSGDLFLLPLHAVPLAPDGGERVCDRFAVSYAPSLSVLASHPAPRRGPADLCAIVNPEGDPQLAYSWVEGAAVAVQFASAEVVRGPTDRQAVCRAMGGRSYVHFCGHASFSWGDPPSSGLDLDGDRLTLADLLQGAVDLSKARLVTLSACETGMSDVLGRRPDEYVGFPAGLLMAGVPCVVSSLWAVADNLATTLLMERFYLNHLQGGMDCAVALAQAQVWLRRLRAADLLPLADAAHQRAAPTEDILSDELVHLRQNADTEPDNTPFSHPFYWAAFTVSGS